VTLAAKPLGDEGDAKNHQLSRTKEKLKMDNNDFDRDVALATSLDCMTLRMEPLRQQLADGSIRTFEDFAGFVIRLGALAGRAGFSAAIEFLQALLAIGDLTDAEISLLADISETLGGDGE
jgi:hypothetical protein